MAHHWPLAARAGLTLGQVDALTTLTLGPLAEDHAFPPRPGLAPDDSLVVDLAYFLVWSVVWPHVEPVQPRTLAALRRRLLARLAERFEPRALEELVWRTAQCVAFNLHNDFFGLDLEAGVSPAPLPATRA